jgi:hypothetical protein
MPGAKKAIDWIKDIATRLESKKTPASTLPKPIV